MVGAKPPLDDKIKKCMMDPRINVFLTVAQVGAQIVN
jgi:hypothetical protein